MPNTDTMEIVIRRSAEGLKTYQVPRRKNQTILDVVSWVQKNLEPDLAYRFACRVGMCGSCAMSVNGIARWTCRTHVGKVLENGRLVIEPLRNFPVIRDLACDMARFFERWQQADGRFHSTKTRLDEIEAISPRSKSRRAADEAIECINCGVCYASCDLVGNNPAYFGPAALNRAWTLMNDQRDGEWSRRLATIGVAEGCIACHSQQGCSDHCPMSINPTRSIAGLKRLVALSAMKGGA